MKNNPSTLTPNCMPYHESNTEYLRKCAEKKKRDAEKKRKHTEIVRAWRAGELSWNEYVRQEKKYRT